MIFFSETSATFVIVRFFPAAIIWTPSTAAIMGHTAKAIHIIFMIDPVKLFCNVLKDEDLY